MAQISHYPANITCTERGLGIAGTRITLYQFMDYIHAGHPSQVIRQDFPQITDEQFEAAMSYIEAHWAEVDAEYHIIVKDDEKTRQYWEERNRERFVQISPEQSKPEHLEIRAKLAAWKAEIESRG
jgi:uncharacterized protein (DUF433 family)